MSTPAQRLARLALPALAAYALALVLLPRLAAPTLPVALGLTFVSFGLLAALMLVGAGGLAATRMPRWAEPLLLLAGLGLWAALYFGLGQVKGQPPPPWHPPLMALAMIVATVGLARLLTTWLVREKNLLPIVLVLMAVVDLWGVAVGPTSQALEVAPELVSKASAALPAIQTKAPMPEGFFLPSLQIGPGDVLFAALILGVVARHALSLRANLLWMWALIMVGLGLAYFTPWAIPGLIFIGLAGLIANRGRWDYTPTERRAILWACVIMVPLLVAAALYFGARGEPLPPEGLTG